MCRAWVRSGDVLEDSCGLGGSTNWEIYRKILTKAFKAYRPTNLWRWVRIPVSELCAEIQPVPSFWEEVRHWLLSITLSKIKTCRQMSLDVYSSNMYAFKSQQITFCESSTKTQVHHIQQNWCNFFSFWTGKSDVWLYTKGNLSWKWLNSLKQRYSPYSCQ